MKAAVLYQTGEPLVVEDGIEIPILQPGQVLVKVAYSGVCKSQLMEARGKRGIDNYLPHLLGHEACGTVVDTGKGVFKVSKNDKVILTWIKYKGADTKGAKYQKGDSTIKSESVTTFSNYTVVSENRCIKLPDGIPMELAPLLGCAVPTGAGIVMNTLRPSEDNTLAIFGLGGIGLSAVMVAKALKCSTIFAVDIEDKKLEKAKELGATYLINNKDGLAVEKIKELTQGEGVDFSIEAAGKSQVCEAAFSSVKDKGGLCILAGHPAEGETIQLNPFDLIKGKKIQGSWGGESQPDRDIPLLAKFFLEGKLPLNTIISHRFKLDEINQALDILEKGDAARILIEMDD
jgi:S-(hydroxymethyl)glutathione dehydrogenase/alcohol dehydrogenase